MSEKRVSGKCMSNECISVSGMSVSHMSNSVMSNSSMDGSSKKTGKDGWKHFGILGFWGEVPRYPGTEFSGSSKFSRSSEFHLFLVMVVLKTFYQD